MFANVRANRDNEFQNDTLVKIYKTSYLENDASRGNVLYDFSFTRARLFSVENFVLDPRLLIISRSIRTIAIQRNNNQALFIEPRATI